MDFHERIRLITEHLNKYFPDHTYKVEFVWSEKNKEWRFAVYGKFPRECQNRYVCSVGGKDFESLPGELLSVVKKRVDVYIQESMETLNRRIDELNLARTEFMGRRTFNTGFFELVESIKEEYVKDAADKWLDSEVASGKFLTATDKLTFPARSSISEIVDLD